MMLRHVFVAVAFALAVLSTGFGNLGATLPPPQVSSAPSSPQRALLDRYCVTCHNQRSKTANVMFDAMDLAHLSQNADIWEKAVRKLRGGMMPPPGARQPDKAAVDSFVLWLENSLDQAAAADPNPGRVALHRLNRVEYANAIEDLVALRVDASALLPKDDEANGFDNVANVLKVSPSFLDQYLSAARLVSHQAIGNATPKTTSTVLGAPRSNNQGVHVEGLPLGTRGGFVAEYLFPADGEYKFNIAGLAGGGYVRGLEYPHTLIMTIDGARVFQENVGGEEDMKAIDQKQAPAVAAINARFQNIRLNVKGGPHKVGVTFIARTFAESDNLLYSYSPGGGVDRIPSVRSVEVLGPYHPVGVTETPSRHKIFVCSATRESEELPCATQILSMLARRAFRRPVTDRDLVAPLAFYKSARETGDFDAGIRSALTAILSSPKFLYRAEAAPENAAPGSIYRISDLDLASRLSFFLWSRMPDDELLDVAAKGKLSDPKVLETQVRRLLADPRSKSLVTNFAFQWLKVRSIDGIDPDAFQFPNFDESLREAFKREMEMFVESILREDRSVLDLVTANYTFVNERLALHYGIPNVRGERFRRVTLEDSNRWGLLGKGSVLMVTSYPNRTGPVLRGAGVAVGLPLLDAMIPAWTALAQTAARPTPHLGFIYFPHGAIMTQWTPAKDGSDFELTPILKPLSPFKKQLTVVSGLANKPAVSPAVHAITPGTWLSCVHPRESQDPYGGVTADQIAAKHIGQDTPLPSLEVATEGGGGGGACDRNFGCSYAGTISFRTPSTPLPMEYNPRKLFERLFGQGDTPQERKALSKQYASILDLVAEEASDLQRKLDPQDRAMLDDYLETVREIERRVQKMEERDLSRLDLPNVPVGTPPFDERLNLMFDMVALAYQANLTRIFSMMMTAEASNQTYNHIGISDAFHPVSHHQNDPKRMETLVKIQTYHTEVFAKFLAKLQKMPDGDGTMLDHSIIVYGSNMSNSNAHNHDPLPTAVVGGWNRLKGGQHLRYPDQTPLANLLLTVLDRAGVPADTFGDSTSKFAEV